MALENNVKRLWRQILAVQLTSDLRLIGHHWGLCVPHMCDTRLVSKAGGFTAVSYG